MAVPTFPDVTLPLQIEAAFGADLMGDPASWSWTDLSGRRLDHEIRIDRGKQPGSTELSAAGMTVVLDNADGQLTPLHPASQWWPYVDMGTPIRVSVTRNANHGFEDSTDDWTVTGGTIARSTAQAHEGVASMLLTPDGVAANAIAVSEAVPVTPGRTWIASGWVYSPNGYSDPAGIAVRLLDDAEQEVSLQQASAASLPAGTWTWQELEVTIPTGVAYAQVAVTVTGSPTAGDVLHADEARLRSVRFAGYANSWQPRFRTQSGGGSTDSTVTLTANGISRRLGQGSPVLRSALVRSTLRQPGLLAYWPLEDQPGASVLASAVPGVGPAQIQGAAQVDVGAGPVAPGSAATVLLTAGVTSGGAVRCIVPSATATGWVAESCFRVEPDTAGGAVWLMRIPDGLGNLWDARASLSGQNLTIALDYTPDDGSTTTLHSEVIPRGTYHQVRVTAEASGSNRIWSLVVDGEQVGGASASGGSQPTSVGWITRVDLSAAELLVGHVAVSSQSDVLLATSTWRAVQGWAGEPATSRLVRLGAETGTDIGIDLWPQVTDSFTRNVADGWGTADSGQEWDSRGTADFDVDGSAGTIVDDDFTGPAAIIADGDGAQDVDVAATLSLGAATNADVGLILRATPDDAILFPSGAIRAYSVEISLRPNPANNRVSSWQYDGEAILQLAEAPLPTTAQPWRVRAQAIGPLIRAKIWSAGEAEPAQWTFEVEDNALTGVGAVGVLTFTDGDTATVDDFSAVSLDDAEAMGAQPVGTLLDVAAECEGADHGVLYESAFGLGYLPRVARYNRPAALNVDTAAYAYSGDDGEVLTPTRDDQGMANTVQAERPDGSSVIAQDVAHAKRYLEYSDNLTVNVESDSRLPSHALWRIFEGTITEMRLPTPVDLAANPDLIDAWLGVELGDRIVRTNLPAIYPPGDVDRVLTGYSEVLGSKAWLVTAEGEPAATWRVGVVAADDGSEDVRGQAVDGEHSTLADPVDDSTTTLSVATDLGGMVNRAPWTTDPDDWDGQLHGGPLLLNIGGEHMQVTNIGAPVPVGGGVATLRDATGTASDATTYSVPAPDLQPGDVLVLCQASDVGAASTLPTPTGGTPWQLLAALDIGGHNAIRVWWKVAGPAEPGTYGLAQDSGADGVAIVASVQDAAAVAPVVATTTQGSGGMLVDTPSTTPHGTDDMELRFPAGNGTGSPRTWSSHGSFDLEDQRQSGGFTTAALYARQLSSSAATGVQSFGGDVTVAQRRGITVNVASAPADAVVQDITVARGDNGISKPHPAGAPVRLAYPARIAL